MMSRCLYVKCCQLLQVLGVVIKKMGAECNEQLWDDENTTIQDATGV